MIRLFALHSPWWWRQNDIFSLLSLSRSSNNDGWRVVELWFHFHNFSVWRRHGTELNWIDASNQYQIECRNCTYYSFVIHISIDFQPSEQSDECIAPENSLPNSFGTHVPHDNRICVYTMAVHGDNVAAERGDECRAEQQKKGVKTFTSAKLFILIFSFPLLHSQPHAYSFLLAGCWLGRAFGFENVRCRSILK